MKVDLPNEAQLAVLKLFDNRFALDLREEWEAGVWTEKLEVEHHNFLRSEEG